MTDVLTMITFWGALFGLLVLSFLAFKNQHRLRWVAVLLPFVPALIALMVADGGEVPAGGLSPLVAVQLLALPALINLPVAFAGFLVRKI
jgi:hypothetical protein